MYLFNSRICTQRVPLSMNAAVLTTPEFVGAVALLLVNDFLLKPRFGNALTGKLSDFAGLFAFTVFWAALLPRYRKAVCLGAGVLFTLWKLPLSDDLVSMWNAAVSWYQVARVADPADLVALVVLPLAYWRAAVERMQGARDWRTVVVACVSLFAFAATSYRTVVQLDETFIFAGSRDILLSRLAELGIEASDGSTYSGQAPPHSWRLRLPDEPCNVDAAVTLEETGDRTEIHLLGMAHRCPRGRKAEERLLAMFEAKVAKPAEMKREVP